MGSDRLTDKQAEALGHRLVACDGFDPMTRMKLRWNGLPATLLDPSTPMMLEVGGAIIQMSPDDEWWPDLRDPATRGCVLEMVREKLGGPGAYARRHRPDLPGRVWCVPVGRGRHAWGETEAEALVAALEAAPEGWETDGE